MCPPDAEAMLQRDREELVAVARRVLVAAKGLKGQVEAYVEHRLSTEVKVYNRCAESVTLAEPRGLGVRFVQGGRQGYAYTSTLTPVHVEATVQAAVAASEVTDPDEHAVLPSPPRAESWSQQAESLNDAGSRAVTALWSADVADISPTEKIALALAAEGSALGAPEVQAVEEAVYGDLDRRVAVVSSEGLEVFGAATYAYVYAYVHAGRNGEVRSALAAQGGRSARSLEPECVGREAAERARGLLGAGPCRSGTYTVVFDRKVVAALVSLVGNGLSADAVQKGRSVFSDKVGTAIGPCSLNLFDDGLHPLGPRSFPFDDEGVVRSRATQLLEGGVVRSLLYDSRTAARAGVQSTANASRASYRSVPLPAASNLILECDGKGELADVVARVGEGLYVVEVSGLHSGVNLVTGEISVGASGRIIRAGCLCEAVHEVTVATDIVSLLSSIVEAGDDACWDVVSGGVLCPTLAAQGIAVSGL